MKKYGINKSIAFFELTTLGYRNELMIAQYERNNIEWKYKVYGRANIQRNVGGFCGNTRA